MIPPSRTAKTISSPKPEDPPGPCRSVAGTALKRRLCSYMTFSPRGRRSAVCGAELGPWFPPLIPSNRRMVSPGAGRSAASGPAQNSKVVPPSPIPAARERRQQVVYIILADPGNVRVERRYQSREQAGATSTCLDGQPAPICWSLAGIGSGVLVGFAVNLPDGFLTLT